MLPTKRTSKTDQPDLSLCWTECQIAGFVVFYWLTFVDSIDVFGCHLPGVLLKDSKPSTVYGTYLLFWLLVENRIMCQVINNHIVLLKFQKQCA